MNKRTDDLNKLFEKWETETPEYTNKFVKDGIINEDLFQKAHPKVLFITKEPNNPMQAPGDFREWWKENLKYRFSYRIAEWSFGLLNNFPIYDDIWRNENVAIDSIHHIAFMNLKKIGGFGSSEYNRIVNNVIMNIDYIQKEIEIIEPEMIILCVTWKEVRRLLFPYAVWKDSGYNVAIARSNFSKVIDFYHPSSRNAPSAVYSLLQNVISSNAFKLL